MTKTVIELRCSELAKANRALLVKNGELKQEVGELTTLLEEGFELLADMATEANKRGLTIIKLKKKIKKLKK